MANEERQKRSGGLPETPLSLSVHFQLSVAYTAREAGSRNHTSHFVRVVRLTVHKLDVLAAS